MKATSDGILFLKLKSIGPKMIVVGFSDGSPPDDGSTLVRLQIDDDESRSLEVLNALLAISNITTTHVIEDALLLLLQKSLDVMCQTILSDDIIEAFSPEETKAPTS